MKQPTPYLVKPYLSSAKLFLILSLLVAIVMGVSIGVCDKVSMQVWLNGEHNAIADFFFRYYTIIGEWFPYVVVGFLVVYKAGWAAFLITDVALSGLIGQGLKYWVNTDRPLTYFANHAPDIQLQLVDGVEMSEWYSFPSGHTITFFALFMTIAIICNKKSLSTLFFVLALLGGYSRIYLNQHFTEDILGGMWIGIITTLGLLFLVPKLDQTRFWNWSLRNLQKK